ncbi:hypothetical protein KAW38_00700 [Candidatus Micrarchaeota archaeon]|nr:hypothetical protein [Candidatus Micrarchaeota archaeon]
MIIKIRKSGEINEILEQLNICADEVVVKINNKIKPETEKVKKGEVLEISYIKHGAFNEV